MLLSYSLLVDFKVSFIIKWEPTGYVEKRYNKSKNKINLKLSYIVLVAYVHDQQVPH